MLKKISLPIIISSLLLLTACNFTPFTSEAEPEENTPTTQSQNTDQKYNSSKDDKTNSDINDEQSTDTEDSKNNSDTTNQDSSPESTSNSASSTTSTSTTATTTSEATTPPKKLSNTDLIKSYYQALEDGKLETAYNLKTENTVTFQTFQSWYKNTIGATPFDFESLGNNRYKFKVNLTESTGAHAIYHVVMEVKNGKLKTISSQEESTIQQSNYRTSALCTDPPRTTEIGSEIYPIAPKYSHLIHLGQIFTAYNCDAPRMAGIDGVLKFSYQNGLRVETKDYPSQNLINTLQQSGLTCAELGPLNECTDWMVEGPIVIENLMRLEPFHAELKSDDCIHCG